MMSAAESAKGYTRPVEARQSSVPLKDEIIEIKETFVGKCKLPQILRS